MAEKSSGRAEKAYGKRSMTFWLVLYAVIGIIVYGIGYVLFMHHGNESVGY